ncbi:MAG: hypothetical protein V3T80_06020 [Kiloniellales bacterium]
MARSRRGGGTPLYQQIKEHIVAGILAGDWPEGAHYRLAGRQDYPPGTRN